MLIEGDSTIFHAINRNKLGYQADLKDPADRARVEQLVAQADVVMHNFRPGVIERLGMDYETVRAINPTVVYGEISGYGTEGPWRGQPGQDLLMQSISGLTWLSGDADDGPVPMGVAVVDIWAGALLVEGLLAALVRRGVTGEGGLVEVNMLEAALDFQFEPMTIHLQDGSLPERTATNNAHALLGAPYGIYATADGFMALAMGSVTQLGELLECPPLLAYPEPASWFEQRDEIKAVLAEHLASRPTQAWLDVLEAADVWCAAVLDWDTLVRHPQFEAPRYRADGRARLRHDLPHHRLPHPRGRSEAHLAVGLPPPGRAQRTSGRRPLSAGSPARPAHIRREGAEFGGSGPAGDRPGRGVSPADR